MKRLPTLSENFAYLSKTNKRLVKYCLFFESLYDIIDNRWTVDDDEIWFDPNLSVYVDNDDFKNYAEEHYDEIQSKIVKSIVENDFPAHQTGLMASHSYREAIKRTVMNGIQVPRNAKERKISKAFDRFHEVKMNMDSGEPDGSDHLCLAIANIYEFFDFESEVEGIEYDEILDAAESASTNTEFNEEISCMYDEDSWYEGRKHFIEDACRCFHLMHDRMEAFATVYNYLEEHLDDNFIERCVDHQLNFEISMMLDENTCSEEISYDYTKEEWAYIKGEGMNIEETDEDAFLDFVTVDIQKDGIYFDTSGGYETPYQATLNDWKFIEKLLSDLNYPARPLESLSENPFLAGHEVSEMIRMGTDDYYIVVGCHNILRSNMVYAINAFKEKSLKNQTTLAL